MKPGLPASQGGDVPTAFAEEKAALNTGKDKKIQKAKTAASIDPDENKFAKIAYHAYFESTTMSVIVSNALWIGIDTEWNHVNMKENGKMPLDPYATIIENLFCVYFTVELAIRFLAFRAKRECIFDAWFVFDSVLVGCMILETWIMAMIEIIIGEDLASIGPLSALRLLRLLRLARVGRLMRFVPELGKLVKGMVKAARSVIFILIFLVLVIYVFAIIFTSTLSDRSKFPLSPYCGENETIDDGECIPEGEFEFLVAQDLFATMGDSFMSLFTRGVLGDNLDETVDAIMEQSIILMWAFFIFLIITFATLLNMLIGVVCDVISDAAAEEEEAETVNHLTITIQEAFEQIDTNEDGLVSSSEWAHIKENKNVRKTLQSVGIETERMEERLQQMQEMLFAEDTEAAQSVPMAFPPADSSPSGAPGDSIVKVPSSDLERAGLTVQELIQKVVDIRPDQNASALDLELLKAQVMKDQKIFKSKLRKIEEGVKKTLGPGAGTGIDTNIPDFPDMPALPDMLGDGKEEEELGELTLEDVPTSMLWEALAMRSNHVPGRNMQGSMIVNRATMLHPSIHK